MACARPGALGRFTLQLPHEQGHNPYLDLLPLPLLFVRKVIVVKYSYGFIVLPGGFGTLDQILKTATLIQTGKIPGFPLVLMGSDYWKASRIYCA